MADLDKEAQAMQDLSLENESEEWDTESDPSGDADKETNAGTDHCDPW